MTNFLQDLAFGFRMLLRRPGFTAIAALSLALGIGANTVVFSLINGLLLRQLGYPEADRLVWVWAHPKASPEQSGSLFGTDYFALRDHNQSFTAIGGQWIDRPSSVGAEENGEPAERITGQQVTPGFFDTLGVKPLLGRTFTDDEDKVDNTAKVIVISSDYWQRRFHGSNDVLGKTLRLDGEVTTIIGVMPPGFQFFTAATDFWSPIPFTGQVLESAGFGLGTIARLKPGVTLQQADAEVKAFGVQRAVADPGRNKDRTNRVESLQEGAYGSLRSPLLLLQGAVAFVLLIGCANVAGLLLARAASRRTEIAVRTAIGASRWRIVRQLITETIPLALVGGLLGILLAWGGLRMFIAYAPVGFLPLKEFTMDARTLGFATVVAIVTAVIFGIVPALQASKTDLASSMKETSRGGSDAAARQHIRSVLVVMQIGLALVLLIGAGLMINSFLRVQTNPLGGDPDGILTFDFRFSQNETIKPFGRYRNAGLWNVSPQTTLAFDRVFARMQTVPGVQAVAAASSRPYSGALFMGFLKDGQSPPPDGGPVAGQMVGYIAITPNFFATMHVPIVQGRDFTDRDSSNGPLVVILNQAMAKRYWPDGSALGKFIRLDYVPGEPLRQIVGIASDMRMSRREKQAESAVYVPYQQQPAQWPGPGWQMRAGMYYLLRTAGQPSAMIPAMRSALADVDPNRPASNVMTIAQYLDQQVEYDRLYIVLLTIFGAIAAVLAAIGIYGVMSYSVAERTREIGIRMALGARSGEVLQLVVRRAMVLIGIGLVLGLSGAFALTRLIREQLYEVTPTDPLTYGVVSLALAMVAVVACIIPARRAVSVDPTIALRYE